MQDSQAAESFLYQQLFLNNFKVTERTWTHKTKMSSVFPQDFVNPAFLSLQC